VAAGAFDVTLVIARTPGAVTADDALFRDALARRGARLRACVWDDAAVDWSRSRLTVMRSMWDYHHAPDAFARWLDTVEPRTTLVNPPATARWNMHKRYLLDLRARGVRTVPTVVVERGQAVDAAALAGRHGWRRFVVKPAISASAQGARLFGAAAADDARAHLAALTGRGDALIQPYVASVERGAEKAVVVLGGVVSHAFGKQPFNGDAGVPLRERAAAVSPAEAAFARHVVAALDEPPAYARVDVAPDADGLVLMEVELIEPALGFAVRDGAADLLARHVLAL
jgi:glutathione synthase/RimK-type ligase-like ATP-grasp enzyme